MTLLLPETCLSTLDTVHHTDLLTLCNALPSQSVDMILCDLPYGTTACTWDEIIPFEPMWAAFKRVIKPRGAIVLTASQPFTSRLISSNLDMFKYSWVWEKSNVTDVFNASMRPLKKHEDIAVFSFGGAATGSSISMAYFPQGLQPIHKVKTNHSVGGNVYGTRPSRANGSTHIQEWTNYPKSVLYFPTKNETEHETEKPVALFEYLIRTYTQPGELVLDPCVGSGTTAVAARQTGRHYICGDSSAEYVATARKRLSQPYTLPMLLEAV